MMTTFDNNQRYHLSVGYGDDYWDLGQDDYWSDSIEELFEEEICTDLSLDEIVEMLNKDGYAQDDNGMWYLDDTFWD